MNNDLNIDEIKMLLIELDVYTQDPDGNFRNLNDIIHELYEKISRSFKFSIKRRGYDAIDIIRYALQNQINSNEFFKHTDSLLLREPTDTELDDFLSAFQIRGE